VRRFSRLGFPLLLATALFALHWFARNNPHLVEDLRLLPKRVNNILLFLAAIPAIFFLVRNLFAGIALHLEDSFQPGDVIRTGDYFGTVEAVRWRGTRIRTFNNNLVIVPNSMLARERVEIFPRTNLNARVLQIGIDYNVPPATVLNVLVQAASNIEGVVHDIPRSRASATSATRR
jgi:hypothetical protein